MSVEICNDISMNIVIDVASFNFLYFHYDRWKFWLRHSLSAPQRSIHATEKKRQRKTFHTYHRTLRRSTNRNAFSNNSLSRGIWWRSLTNSKTDSLIRRLFCNHMVYCDLSFEYNRRLTTFRTFQDGNWGFGGRSGHTSSARFKFGAYLKEEFQNSEGEGIRSTAIPEAMYIQENHLSPVDVSLYLNLVDQVYAKRRLTTNIVDELITFATSQNGHVSKIEWRFHVEKLMKRERWWYIR